MDRFLKVFGAIVVVVIAFKVVGWIISSLVWLFWVGLVAAVIALPIVYIRQKALNR